MEAERNEIIANFAKQLRLRRHELALTQEQLAEKAKLNWSYIGELERGERNPAITTAMALAKALDTSLENFFQIRKGNDETVLKNSEFFVFFDLLFKVITLSSSISNENIRTSLIPQLTLLGFNYFKAQESGDFKELSKKMRVSHESIEEILTNLSDKKLAHRISSSVYQMNLILQD